MSNFMVPLDRRRLIRGASAIAGADLLGLAGCATASGPSASGVARPARLQLAPIRAETDRIFDITVCLRPFRAAGPRLDAEQLGDTLVVHNYGHGGSGWSLSWGSGAIAVGKAMAGSPREIAVVGCGALGLTSAILAQQAGAKVTIYARDLLPQTRSARATGAWTPDSRIALTSAAAPGFAALWEQMARASFKTYRNYLGLPGNPVEWIDRYNVFDNDPDADDRSGHTPGALDFAQYNDRIRDLTPRTRRLPAGATPFPTPWVERGANLIFNIADYGHTLMTDFLIAGGRNRAAGVPRALRTHRAEGKGRDQLPWLRRQSPLERCLYHPRAWTDRLAHPPAGGHLRRLLSQRECPAAPRRHGRAGPRRRRYARLWRDERDPGSGRGGRGGSHHRRTLQPCRRGKGAPNVTSRRMAGATRRLMGFRKG